jgi:FtsH-binding integral membrane protein
MNNFNNAQSSIANLSQAQIDEGLRSHMLRVYNYMSAALALTGIVAWFSATSGLYVAIANTMLIYVVMFAPLGVVFYFASKINSMSASKAQSVFWVFAGLMGLSLSYIFLAYTGTAVFQAFFVTAGAFASLSLWGYTTKKDLSAMGAFLIMGPFWFNYCFCYKSFCWQRSDVIHNKYFGCFNFCWINRLGYTEN